MDSLIAALGLQDETSTDTFETRLVTATVVGANADLAVVSFVGPRGAASGLLPVTEYLPGHTFIVGDTFPALLLEDAAENARPLLSVARPQFVTAVLDGLSPEVRSGAVRVMGVARQVGQRTKIAVAATVEGVDPVAACVGRAHNRVDAIKAALGGEQVDIIAWHPEQAVFLRNALQPAAVDDVVIDSENRTATAVAPAHQMSAAVGGGGLNSALAGRLVGLTVRILPAS